MFEDKSECFFIDVIDEIIEKALLTILSNDPLGACLSHEDLRLFNLGNIMDEIDSNLDSTPHLKSFSWVSTYESLPPMASSPMPPFIMSHLTSVETSP